MAEKGIELETVQVDLGSGEQFSEAFRNINPDCVVPVLQLDDGTILTEVIAICDYLESQFPEPPLMGSTTVERATVLMWNAKVEQQGLWAKADAFRNTAKGLVDKSLPGPDPYPQIPELAERGRARVQSFFKRIDAQLADSPFIAGDFYSVADISAQAVVDFAAWLKIKLPDDANNVARWYQTVSARASASA